MAALFFQIICYFGELGKGGLEIFDDFGGDDVDSVPAAKTELFLPYAV
jgi:hypothetical protein